MKRGDSGTNHTKKSWIKDGTACTIDGMRHDQLLLMLLVPYVNHAATMEPPYQVVL